MVIDVAPYEPHMEDQVIDLLCLEYGHDRDAYAPTFRSFYEHSFQRDSGLRVVALDGQRVVGFQSFFFWPYVYGRPLRTFQSGNSLVHPGYRGQGIFQKLLRLIYELAEECDVSFLMGFPVEGSFRSFLRNGWTDVVDLRWYAKPLWPFFFLHRFRDDVRDAFPSRRDVISEVREDCFRLGDDPEFLEWRAGFTTSIPHYFEFEEGEIRTRFELKFSRRGRWLREAVIGDLRTNTRDEQHLERAFVALAAKLRRLRFAAYVSIAINEGADSSVATTLKKTGFRRLAKTIHFIVRNITSELPIEDPEKWILYRSDIDTW